MEALAICESFYIKDFYLMGKALPGELSCMPTGLVVLPVTSISDTSELLFWCGQEYKLHVKFSGLALVF